MGYSTLQLCSGGGAFEAVPRPRLTLDLAESRRRLESEGVHVVDARVMLIAKMDPEVTISRDGRIVVKSRDKAAAQRSFEQVARWLGIATESPSTAHHG